MSEDLRFDPAADAAEFRFVIAGSIDLATIEEAIAAALSEFEEVPGEPQGNFQVTPLASDAADVWIDYKNNDTTPEELLGAFAARLERVDGPPVRLHSGAESPPAVGALEPSLTMYIESAAGHGELAEAVVMIVGGCGLDAEHAAERLRICDLGNGLWALRLELTGTAVSQGAVADAISGSLESHLDHGWTVVRRVSERDWVPVERVAVVVTLTMLAVPPLPGDIPPRVPSDWLEAGIAFALDGAERSWTSAMPFFKLRRVEPSEVLATQLTAHSSRRATGAGVIAANTDGLVALTWSTSHLCIGVAVSTNEPNELRGAVDSLVRLVESLPDHGAAFITLDSGLGRVTPAVLESASGTAAPQFSRTGTDCLFDLGLVTWLPSYTARADELAATIQSASGPYQVHGERLQIGEPAQWANPTSRSMLTTDAAVSLSPLLSPPN